MTEGNVAVVCEWAVQSPARERLAREYVINTLKELTGKTRGEVTEAIIDVERATNQKIIDFVLDNALDVLIALLKQLLA